jgi:hypothetical protein
MRNISGVFDSSADAESARQQLTELGVPQDAVHILQQRSGIDARYSRSGKIAWSTLVRRLFMPGDSRDAQRRALPRSVFVLTASVDATLVAAVVVTLENSKAIELDEHQKYWRRNVWRGSSAASAAIDERAVTSRVTSARKRSE